MRPPVGLLLVALLMGSTRAFWLSGTIRDFTTTDTALGFNRADSNEQLADLFLDYYGKPTLRANAISIAASSFYQWFNTPASRQDQLMSFAVELTPSPDGGNKYRFASNSWYPIDGALFGTDIHGHNKLFTFELKAHFTYSAGLTFKFASSDDMYVFINGRRVTSTLGGIHPRLEETVIVDDHVNTANLATGRVAQLAIFWASRSSGSRAPAIQIEMTTATLCSAASAGALVRGVYPFTLGANPSLSTSGDAQLQTTTSLRLTQNNRPTAGSSAWHKTRLNVANGFVTKFNWRMLKGGLAPTPTGTKAEGFAFVIQADSDVARGGSSHNLGYNIPKSLAVEFDVNQNPLATDPNPNHIEVHTRYALENSPAPVAALPCYTSCTNQGCSGTCPLLSSIVTIDDGATHTAYIQYVPRQRSASEGVVTVVVDNKLVGMYLVNHNSLMAAMPDGLAYVGFTGSTSDRTVDTFITDWEFYTTPISAPQSTAHFASGAGWTTDNVLALGTKPSSPVFVVKARDACNSELRSGGQTIAAAIFETSPFAAFPTETDVLDNGDGTYSVWFWHSKATQTRLVVTLDGQDITGSPFNFLIRPNVPSAAHSVIEGTAPSTFEAGESKQLTVVVRDQYGNNQVAGNAVVRVRFSSSDQDFAHTSVTSGYRYLFNVASNKAESSSLFIRLAGVDIAGSPLSVVVTAGPASAAHSTVTGTALTFATSGVQATITLTPRDRFGNIKDSSSLAITFTPSCGDGTPKGTASYVGPGPTWALQFTPGEAGSCTLSGTLGGNPLTELNQYAPIIAPGALNAGKSRVMKSATQAWTTGGTPSFTAGASSSFVIQAKDAYGNNRQADNSPAQHFHVRIQYSSPARNTDVLCNSGFENTTATVRRLRCNYDTAGRYVVQFEPLIAQTGITVLVTLGSAAGTPVDGDTSYTFGVVPAIADAGASTLDGATLPDATAGVASTFTITSRDQFGNVRSSSDDAANFDVSITRQGAPAAIVLSNKTRTNGVYTQPWTATVTGQYVVRVRLGGVEIEDSGKTVAVKPAAAHAASCVVFGSGLSGGMENTDVSFSIQARDQYGNNLETNPAGFSVTFVGASISASPVSVGSGLYTVTYTLPGYVVGSSTFTIRVTLNGATVKENTATIGRSGDRSYATVELPSSTQAGKPSTFRIADRDENDNVVTDGDVIFTVAFSHAREQFQVGATYNAVLERYEVTFTCRYVGDYTVRVRAGGVETDESKPGNLTVSITVGDIAGRRCQVDGLPAIVVAGSPQSSNSYTITLRDSNDNLYDSALDLSQFSVTFAPSLSTDATASFTSLGNGVIQVNYSATAAGFRSLNTHHGSGPARQNLGPRDDFPFTVVPSDFAQSQSTVSADAFETAIAGVPHTLRVVLRDRFRNAISPAHRSRPTVFNVSTTLEGPGVSTTEFFSDFYLVTWVPMKSHASPLEVTVTLDGALVGSASISVVPGDFNPATSEILGLTSGDFTAGDPITLSLVARDVYGNLLPDTNVQNDFEIIAEWLEAGLLRTRTLQAADVVPGSGTLTCTLERGVATLATSYAFRVNLKPNRRQDGIPGNVAVTVKPAAPVAARTMGSATAVPTIPAPTNFSAGSAKEFSIRLRDQYNNEIRTGGNLNRIRVTYYSPLTCLGQAVNGSNVNQLFASGSGIIDAGNGVYTIRINTTRAGSYSAFLEIAEGQERVYRPVIGCRDSSLSFIVEPLSVDASKSLITTPPNAVAGETLTLVVTMRDQYLNPVNQGGQVVEVGEAPTSPAGACSAQSANWLRLDRDDTNSTQFLNSGGVHTIRFRVTVAKEYILVVTVDGIKVGDATDCPTFKVTHHLPDTFSKSAEPPVQAAVPSSFEVHALDRFSNPVLEGDHSYTVEFRREFDTKAAVGEYAFRLASQDRGSFHQVDYTPAWHGRYRVSITIDPKSGAQSSLAYSMNVSSATCGVDYPNTRYRCVTGECVSSYSQCPGGDPTTCRYKCPTGSAVPCANSIEECGSCVRCPQGFCVDDIALCPRGFDDGKLPHRCPDGSRRQSAADCPSVRVCPPGWVSCNDAQSCAPTSAACPDILAAFCGSEQFRCSDGRCVDSAESCPTDVTCPAGQVRCSDGSCKASFDTCAPDYVCHAPNVHRCPDGSCRTKASDCPTRISCPSGWALCENGHCSPTLADCGETIHCAPTDVRCPDGSCRPNLLLCPTPVSCHPNVPVLCPDGLCAASAHDCRTPTVCKAPRGISCPGGFCAASNGTCPTVTSCPAVAPVRCADGSCTTDKANCAVLARCPASAPIRCPYGECRVRSEDCSTLSSCPASSPVRCPDGRCVAAPDICEGLEKLRCPSGFSRCPGGECVQSLDLCPTHLTCPPAFERCWDGTCRASCAGLHAERVCGANQVACPQAGQGVACAPSLDQCPHQQVCPAAEPVRCPDLSCAPSYDECPQPEGYSSVKVACPSGGWAPRLDLCDTPVTCPPSSPAKCWDETCRVLPEDCPARPRCPTARAYLCPDGSCVPDLWQCPTRIRCSGSTPIKCAVGGCVSNSTFCIDPLTRLTLDQNACPDGGRRCKNGACMSDQYNCEALTCPHYASFRCPNGQCARREAECPNPETGCPFDRPFKCATLGGACVADEALCTVEACPDTARPVRCPDGSCAVTDAACERLNATGCLLQGQERCFDKTCVAAASPGSLSLCLDARDGANACPPTKPFRCDNGLCAASSSRCPLLPQVIRGNVTCEYSELGGMRSYRCGDGSCALTPAQCPIIKPCGAQQVRCDDGSCKPDGSCPTHKSCPTSYKRCADGLCVPTDLGCIDPAENSYCPQGHHKCDSGHCVSLPAMCSSPEYKPSSNGCANDGVKCLDGSCAATAADCPVRNGCPRAKPFLCPDGSCKDRATNCTGTTCTGVRCGNGACATSYDKCKAANGCPATTPYRCADGSCKRFPASFAAPSAEACEPTVVCDEGKLACADGTCVSDKKHCRPVWPCPLDLERCKDQTCRRTCEGLSDRKQCPASAPVLCPSGACKKHTRECEAFLQDSCPKPQFRCADGTCVNALVDCAERTFRTLHPGATWTLNMNHDSNFTCRAGGFACSNGACVPSREHCPLVPRCPTEFPVRCPDGSCIGDSSTCAREVGQCPAGLRRCEDGFCRFECLPFDGCPLAAPFYCAGKLNPCVSDKSECVGSPLARRLLALDEPEACPGNCPNQLAIIPQATILSPRREVTLDLSIDDSKITRNYVTFPAGTFSEDVTVSVRGVSSFTLNRPNFPFASKVLSAPWRCEVSGRTGPFDLNATVFGSIDYVLYETEKEEEKEKELEVPCELQGSFDVTHMVSTTRCYGEAAIGKLGIDSTTECDGKFVGTLLETFEIKGWDGSDSHHQIKWNVTDAPAGSPFRVGREVCMTFKRSQDRVDVYVNEDPFQSAECPEGDAAASGVEGVRVYTYIPRGGGAEQCAGKQADDGVKLIPPEDICLGTLDPLTNQWRCLEGYYERVRYPTWRGSGPRHRVVGHISTCDYPVYAFLHIPLPPEPQPYVAKQSWWDQYKWVVIGSVGGTLLFIIISAYVISRLYRYRIKYKAKKKELDELQERALDLDENAGGLGIADGDKEDIEMVANPLVVQMHELEAQVAKINDDMGREGEEMAQIDDLEKERQRLFAEIEAIKAQLREQAASKAATRIEDDVSTSAGMASQSAARTDDSSSRSKPKGGKGRSKGRTDFGEGERPRRKDRV